MFVNIFQLVRHCFVAKNITSNSVSSVSLPNMNSGCFSSLSLACSVDILQWSGKYLITPLLSYWASPAIWDQTASTDTGKHTLLQTPPDRPVLDSPTPEGWKAELTLVLTWHKNGIMVYLFAESHPSRYSNLIESQTHDSLIIVLTLYHSATWYEHKWRFSTANRACLFYQTPPLLPYLNAHYSAGSTTSVICLPR